MNLIFRKNFKNAVERVLHVPHNYTGGILEMTFVLDYALSKECAVSMTKEIAAVLRSQPGLPECPAQPFALEGERGACKPGGANFHAAAWERVGKL